MERLQNEKFADYKLRRAAASRAVKLINVSIKKGGTISARQKLRDAQRKAGKLRATYGRNLMAQFAQRLATPARLAIHKAYLVHMDNRLVARLLAS